MSKTIEFEKSIRERQRLLFGERYAGNTLGSIRAPNWAQIKINDFLKKSKNFLVYCGSPGIGKTYLCSCLVPWAMENFKSFRYFTEHELLKRVRNSMQTLQGDYLDTLKLLIDDPFLMIDDLGSCGVNEWREEIIFNILDQRYNSMLPTIITSNFSVAEFKKTFHGRIASRLFASENMVIEINNGEDLRCFA